MYFKAKSISGKSLFLKLDSKVGCVKNEMTVCDYLNKNSSINAPLVCFYKNYESMDAVVFNYLEGKPLAINDIINSPELLYNLYDIITEFNQMGFSHRDIKLDNFILSTKLFFIDFTYTELLNWSNNMKEVTLVNAPRSIEKDLGEKLTNERNSWNDFFSFLKIIDCYISQVDSAEVNQNVYLLREKCHLKAAEQRYIFTSSTL
jgi:predicted Ser/Thr protein kinase